LWKAPHVNSPLAALITSISPPPATVYGLDRASADGLFEAVLASLAATPPRWSAETGLEAETDMQSLDVPVFFDYGLELLGYRVLSGVDVGPGQTVELVTVWRATAEMPPLVVRRPADVRPPAGHQRADVER